MSEKEKAPTSKIIGIQFSILSPDEIRKLSVAEITTRDTYINNKPVIGGLFDPRMGVLEPGLICPTDGHNYINTPGYFGHIELARPVFYIQFLNTILKIVRCVCIKCSKLLISKEKYKHALTMKNEDRWNYVYSLIGKCKRCGDCNEDGCGCKQPTKYKKEGLASLFAEWDAIEGIDPQTTSEKLSMKLTPEIMVKIFRRISDEDVAFMGFSPIWSRPDWMICQVLAVPPPAVRPSVKHDAQQRSEDDISHILVNIIKANKTLQEKIQQDANANIIDDWTTVLQYYIATMIDNKIPGVASVAQRSGRALKSIKERLNGKGGRVRGNLMGKRVDYSARSVITPDPNLSIKELGIPMKIAKNITRPILVNKRNKNFLMKLVNNGPDVHPGAKILEKKNGENISLRYVDRSSLNLEIGDVVHRHMMDGDAILFNRQPTLHRMSMMCHIAKIMKKGDTFRMNVGCTKPYNADFDGDEMNLHMPQDVQAETELRNLAAVPYQIISPANNQSIVGIFQDSLLGCYRFTSSKIKFTPLKAMNLLVNVPDINEQLFKTKNSVSNFEILTQILPPLSIYQKTKKFKSDDDQYTSNNVIEINNGKYIRGQLDKSVLGSGTKGLIHRICNDFGNYASANFIDNIQFIVNEFMKSSAYSVGISDLIADNKTNKEIAEVITDKKKEVKNLIDETQLGIFENNTGKTNEEEFETQVNNILNEANAKAGKIGINKLSKDNRFVIMVEAGSKGSDINISQMISCLGQQNVDGKRIPYGFEHRTLPHFPKFDDSPVARGFVESSFISGLTPEELFFHAMGGRTGLIDTAVKTSQTGYIQRRLIKGMEDLHAAYDGTIRNNKNKVVQFRYGDDGFDPTKVENQSLPICSMTLEDIYAHFNMPGDNMSTNIFTTNYTQAAKKRIKKQATQTAETCQKYITMMLEGRTAIMQNIFKFKNDNDIHIPVAFNYLINNVQKQQFIDKKSLTDITPLETFKILDETFNKLEMIHYYKPTQLFKLMFYYYLSPKELLMVKHFNKKALIVLMDTIVLQYKQAIVAPGEMCGMIAAQSIGEPTTQLTLNTFHFAGVASKSNVTRGVPRIEEILSISENPKNPSITVYLKPQDETNNNKAKEIASCIEHTKLRDVTSSIEICFDPDDLNTLINEDKTSMLQYKDFTNMIDECLEEEAEVEPSDKSKWIIRLELDKETMLERNITIDDINFAIKNSYKDDISCIYNDYNEDKLIMRLRLLNIISNSAMRKKIKKNLDQSDEIYLLKGFQEQLLNNIVLRGIKNIQKVILRKLPNNVSLVDGDYKKQEVWVLDTIGSNMTDILSLDYIDVNRTFSNNIQETYRVLGIEAARQTIYNELSDVLEEASYINYHHLSLLCDRMSTNVKLTSIFRHGINNDNIGPIAKASFEETPEMFLKAARHAEFDNMRGVSANVMCGQEGYYGTSAFQTILDMEEMVKIQGEEYTMEDPDVDCIMETLEDPDDPCSTNNLAIQNNAINIKKTNMGDDNDYNIDF